MYGLELGRNANAVFGPHSISAAGGGAVFAKNNKRMDKVFYVCKFTIKTVQLVSQRQRLLNGHVSGLMLGRKKNLPKAGST